MIRETAVTALDGLVGFKQPYDTDYDILDAGNLATSSGLVFEDATGIVTIRNILDTFEYDSLSEVQANEVLDNLRSSAARDILNKIFRGESTNIESNTLFPYEDDFLNTYDLVDDFYFIEIEPTNNKRISISLDNIWLSFNEAETFNIYLYHSKKLAPIQTKSVTTVANEATKVYLGYQLDDTGTYRIGYKKADVGTAKPFKREFELSNAHKLSQSAEIEYNSANFLANGRIDVNNVNALEDGYGLNLEYSSFIDWTHEIVKNKDRFARALQLQLAITLADRLLTTTRSGITERLTRESLDRIGYVLGSEEQGVGIKGQLRKELTDIKHFFFPKKKIINATLK